MTSRNPLGQMIQRMHAPDDNFIVDDCQKSAYTTVTVLDAATLAGRIQSEGGVPYTIFRDSKWEPGILPETISDADLKAYALSVYKEVRARMAQCGNPNVHIMVNCEQGSSATRIRMYTELVKLSATDQHGAVGMVLLNASIGSIKTGFWGQANEFARADMIEFIKTMDKYRNIRLASGAYAFVLGVHNYTSQYAWIAVNGGEHRMPTWDMANSIKIDWNKPQDHLGREYQGIRKALGWEWDEVNRRWYAIGSTLRRLDGTPVEPPWFIATEVLIDDVGGVPVQADHIDGGAKPRGFNSMKTQWEQYWFKPDSHGVTLAKMSEWAWRKVYHLEGYFIGFNNFCIGNTGGWDSFTTTPNGSPNKDYFDTIRPIRFNMPDHFFAKPAVVPVPPPVVPPPVIVVPPPVTPPTPPPVNETGYTKDELARQAVIFRQLSELVNELYQMATIAYNRAA